MHRATTNSNVLHRSLTDEAYFIRYHRLTVEALLVSPVVLIISLELSEARCHPPCRDQSYLNMQTIRDKARRSLDDIKFTGRLGEVQVIDSFNLNLRPELSQASISTDDTTLMRHASFRTKGDTAYIYPSSPNPGFLTHPLSREQLLARIKTSDPSLGPDCLLVYISLSHGLALDIDKTLFLDIFHAMNLDPLMLRFLGKWDPGSCQPSSTTDGNSGFFRNYMRNRGHCMMWAYDSARRNVRGIVMPKSFDPDVHRIFRPDFRFLNGLVANLALHRDLIPEEHGFTFICCLSIVERVAASLAAAYRDVALVEQDTGFSTWNEGREMDVDDMTRDSKDIGRAKHVLLITKRHIDCVNLAYDMVVGGRKPGDNAAGSPAVEVMRFLRGDLDALQLELDTLMERAKNQMDVVGVPFKCEVVHRVIAKTDQLNNLMMREEAKASIRLADASLKIAEAAKSDSGAMKTVAIMTMLFLPATFFAALFSMPLLRWEETIVIQDRFWVYWW